MSNRWLALIFALGAVVAIVSAFHPQRTAVATQTSEAGSSWTLFGGIGSAGAGSKSGSKWPANAFGEQVVKEYEGSFDLENLSAVAFVEKYRFAATSGGNPDAAYRIYRAEAMCSRVPDLERRHAEVIDVEAAACVGVTPAMMYERYQFLRQAALAGIEGAAVDFLQEGPPGQGLGQSVPAEWANDAVNYLKIAGEKGDRDALYQLIHVYQEGQLAPADPQRELTYRVAMTLMQSNHADPERNPIIQRLSSGLPPDKVASAYHDGRAIVARCCETPSSGRP